MDPSLNSYLSVFATIARNSLVRDMTFRSNFLIECGTSVAWMTINLCFYLLLYQFADEIGRGSGWSRYPFFVFLATGMFVNGLMQTFVMGNIDQFSELIRTGKLDFALLKPIDAQFLISFQRVQWSSLSMFIFGTVLLVYSLNRLNHVPGPIEILLYPFYILCGVAILYSVMICLAATSVWMGRNQTLYDLWFYITNFSRYPLEIYEGRLGLPLRWGLSFFVPILLAINVPARFMAKPLQKGEMGLACFAAVAAAGSLLLSRWVFGRSLIAYRSASS